MHPSPPQVHPGVWETGEGNVPQERFGLPREQLRGWGGRRGQVTLGGHRDRWRRRRWRHCCWLLWVVLQHRRNISFWLLLQHARCHVVRQSLHLLSICFPTVLHNVPVVPPKKTGALGKDPVVRKILSMFVVGWVYMCFFIINAVATLKFRAHWMLPFNEP